MNVLRSEDQQRINTFSNLNNRIRIIQEKLGGLKVILAIIREGRKFVNQTKHFTRRFQQEKEALDDLSTELELADEDEPVRYAPFHFSWPLDQYSLDYFLLHA